MRARDRQQQQNRVEPHERRRRLGRTAHARRRAGGQRHRAKARGDGERLQRPQAAAEPEQRERVAAEREQRAVRGVLKRPADEGEDRVRRGFGGDVRIGVHAVQHPQPRKRQVAEHVLGDQRRTQQQQRIGCQDRYRDGASGERSHRQQHRRVADAEHQRPQLEPVPAKLQRQSVQRSRQPAGPAAAAGGHQRAGGAGGAHHDREKAYRYRHQTRQPERTKRSWSWCGCGDEKALIAVGGRRGR